MGRSSDPERGEVDTWVITLKFITGLFNEAVNSLD